MADSDDRANAETRSDWLGDNSSADGRDGRQAAEPSIFGRDLPRDRTPADETGIGSRVVVESVDFWQALHGAPGEATLVEEQLGELSLDQQLLAQPNVPVWIGPYRLERKIGAGGFSRIYAARHRLRPDLVVAVKLLNSVATP